MDNIRHGLNAAAEKVKEVTRGASAEANKEKAKDSNQSLGNRAGGAIDYAGDKIKESGHAANKEAHKEAAKH